MLQCECGSLFPNACLNRSEDTCFLPTQGLLQNVRFIFDTTVEDVLQSRDCEVTKPGKRDFFVQAPYSPHKKNVYIRDIFMSQIMSQNAQICKQL